MKKSQASLLKGLLKSHPEQYNEDKKQDLKNNFIIIPDPELRKQLKTNDQVIEKLNNSDYEILPPVPKLESPYSFNEMLLPGQEPLPVHNIKDLIVKTIQKYRVTIISGNTGCGKSTQIPKFIALESHLNKIIVTQPRRVAAVALAQRVSEELKTNLGGRVGYQIGQESCQTKSTQILYVTIGIFLQKLVNDAEAFLSEYTHIILDEVHERGIESDFGLIALKTFLSLSPNSKVKLVVMSATLNKDIFLNYFSDSELSSLKKEIIEDQFQQENYLLSQRFSNKQINLIQLHEQNHSSNFWPQNDDNKEPWVNIDYDDDSNNAQADQVFQKCIYDRPYQENKKNYVEIEVKQAYKVTVVWLDNIDTSKKYCNKNYFNKRKPELNEDLYGLVAFQVKRVLFQEESMLEQLYKQNGSILIFLPGYNEIIKMRQSLEDEISKYQQKSKKKYPYKILELHSSLGDINIREILSQQSYQKIILATNIAESSITIPFCFVVFDFCLTKEINYNHSNGIERLELAWSSKASITQRAGRTGRNCDGFNIRIIPKVFYDNEIKDYQTPEILRCPIEKVILKIKILDEGEDNHNNIQIISKDQQETELIDEVIQQIKTKAKTEDEQQSDIKKQYEKQEFSLQKIRMFEDPVRVLQRAIESPLNFNIYQSMENLISIGALKLIKVQQQLNDQVQQRIKIKVTKLGRFYNDIPCNIKLGKFICFGYFFDCLIECITIASIFSQRKQFFTPFQKICTQFGQIAQFTDVIFQLDGGHSSDMIIQLKLFREWEQKFFFPQYQKAIKSKGISKNESYNEDLEEAEQNLKDRLSQTEQDDQSSLYLINRRYLNQFKNQFYSHEEKNWCRQHFCDPKILREIIICREDFKLRIPKEAGNINDIFKHKDLNDEEQVEKIKFCLAGAFNKYTIKSDIVDPKEMKKIKQLLIIEDMNPFNTIIFENTRYMFSYMSDEQRSKLTTLLINSMENFCNKNLGNPQYFPLYNKTEQHIKKITLKYSSIYIEFLPFTYLNLLIKKILTLKQRFWNFSKLNEKLLNKFHECDGTELLNKYHQCLDFLQVIIQDQNIIKYAYQARLQLTNQNMNNIVQLESDSINFITLGDFNRYNYLVAFDLMCRGHKLVAQGITLMPIQKPLFLAIASLIFGSKCYINSDGDGKKYQSINVDGTDIQLDHYILDKDIDEINQIRKELKKCLDEDSFFNWKANKNIDLWNKIKSKLFSRQVLRHVDCERWEQLFQIEYTQNNSKLIQQISSILNQRDISKINQSFNKIQPLFNNKRRKNNIEKQTYASEKGFMNLICKSKAVGISQQVIFSNQSNIDLLNEYFDQYNQWKKKVYKQLIDFYILQSVNQIMVTCKKCFVKYYYNVLLFNASKIQESQYPRIKKIDFNTFTDYLHNKQILFHELEKQRSLINFKKNQVEDYNNEEEDNNDERYNFLFIEFIKTYVSKDQNDYKDFYYYSCQNGHLVGYSLEQNQMYNTMYIPDVGNLELLFPGLQSIDFTKNEFIDFNIEKCNKISEHKERQAEKLLDLQELKCTICLPFDENMDQNQLEQLYLYNNQQGQDWNVLLEKHMKTDIHKNNEELFLKSTRNANYFYQG